MTRFLGAITLFVSGSVWAQTDRGTITGTVSDPSGAAIPAATVVATKTETNTTFTTITAASGDFTIPFVPVGDYTIRVEQQGFKASVTTGLTVMAGTSLRANIILQVGSLSESIEVSSQLAQIQTDNSKITAQVSNKMVEELPLVVSGAMRSAFDLAIITPEAKSNPGNGTATDASFALGGGQGGAWGITLDGVSAGTGRFGSMEWASVNTPSLDAITEFAVDTNGFKAEYGRASGGIMTFSSKSGTNEIHGTAYEFLRNNVLDARRFFEAERGIYKQHDFGYSVGGPVVLPKIYNGKNRTFFFTSAEWFRNRVGAASQFFNVPTPEMYQGDFSNWVDNTGRRLPVYDPATTRPNPAGGGLIRDPFANNMIPQARFANFSRSVLQQIGSDPFPNNGAAPGTSDYVRNNYVNRTGVVLDPWTKISAKIDHNLTDKQRLAYLYNYGRHQRTPGPDGFPGLRGVANTGRFGDQRSDVHRFTYNYTVTPTLVFYAYGGWNLWKEANRNVNAIGGWADKVCLKGAWDCDANFPQIDFSDYSTWGGSAGDGSENIVMSYGNDLTWVKGRQTLKFGYLWERIHYNGFGRQSLSGLVRGDRRSTSVPGNNNLLTGGGNGFASFLLGESFSGGTENDRFVGQQWRSHSWYVQNDIRVNRRLTVNLGLRYEMGLAPLEQQDRWSDFTPDRPNPGAGGIPGALRFAGFGEGRENSRTLIPSYFGGLGPRASFAYSIDDKTVIRAGAARSFGLARTITGSTHFDGFIIIFRPTSTDNGVTPAFRVDDGLPAYPRPPFINPSFSNGNNIPWWQGIQGSRMPQSYDWTFSLQRQVGNSMVLEGNYQATMGSGLIAGLLRYNQLPFSFFEQYGNTLLQSNINSPAAQAAGLRPPFPGFNGSVAQSLRPYPQYLDINTQAGTGDKSGHSTYHAMVLKLDKRTAQGVTLQSSYVFSKLITDADNANADNSALDHYNRRLEKSIGQLDQTHNLRLSGIWDLPFGKGKRFMSAGGPLSYIAGNWRISGFLNYNSGTPLDFSNGNVYNIFNGRSAIHVQSYDNWITDFSGRNPNWLGDDRFFQTRAAFGPQPANLLGTMTRHNPKARTPWLLNENVSIAKMFPITERVRLDFRAEAFNLANRMRPGTGSRNIDDPNFGVVRGQLNDPRRLQFGLKLYF
jgi:hypothetical protein